MGRCRQKSCGRKACGYTPKDLNWLLVHHTVILQRPLQCHILKFVRHSDSFDKSTKNVEMYSTECKRIISYCLFLKIKPIYYWNSWKFKHKYFKNWKILLAIFAFTLLVEVMRPLSPPNPWYMYLNVEAHSQVFH